MASDISSSTSGTSEPTPSRQGEVDPRRYWALFRKYTWSFAITFVLVFAAVAALAFTLPPKYKATSRVVLDTRVQSAIDPRATGAAGTQKGPDAGAVDSEVEVLKSRDLAGRVVDTLKLDQDREINPDGLKGPEGKAVAVSSLLEALKVGRTGVTYVLDISITSGDAAKAAVIANAYAASYVRQSADLKVQATSQASTVLGSQLEKMRTDVEKAEAAVERYKVQHNLLSVGATSLTESEIPKLNVDLATARTEEAGARARYETARAQMARGGTGEDVGEALSSAVVQNLRSQRAVVSRQLADLKTRYGPLHPSVIQTQQQLTDLDSQIRAEVRRIISNLEAEVQIAHQRTEAASRNVNASHAQLAANSTDAVGLNELQRNADVTKSMYQDFLEKYKLAIQSQGLESSDARVLSQAVAPGKPSFPNKPLLLALGIVLGAVAGLAMVVVRNLLDATVSTAEQVEQKLGTAFLASVPLVEGSSKARDGVTRMVIEKPISAYAEAMRNLRTSVQFGGDGRPVSVIALTSALPGEGKTTTTIGMARSAAQGGMSVVLIDCDVRRASSARALGIQAKNGLIELLRGQATLDEVLVQDPISGAVFLPIAKPSADAEELISSKRMFDLVAELRKRFQLVLLDTAPVLAVADTRVLAREADAVVLLCHWRKTPRKATEAALQQLESVGAFVAGVALTCVNLTEQARSGYGDSTYFYEAYRQYYSE